MEVRGTDGQFHRAEVAIQVKGRGLEHTESRVRFQGESKRKIELREQTAELPDGGGPAWRS